MTVLKVLATIGLRGARARIFTARLASGADVVRIQWREGGRRRTESWPNSPENRRVAKATAEGVVERLQRRGLKDLPRVTVRDLADRYTTAKLPEWREATRVNTAYKWKSILAVIPPSTFADLVTPETLDELRKIMRGAGRAPSQVAGHITQIKAVFAFAKARKLIVDNPIADYRVRLGKDDRPRNVEEYTPEEADAILRELDYRKLLTWRTWAAVTLAAVLGCRQRALLHLEWRDVDLTLRTVRWRHELDKRGNERVQPLPRAAVFAFRVAKVWRARMNYDGRFIFPAGQERRGDRPWTYQALVAQLHHAETRAGVEHKPYRAMHGLRRMAAKNVLAITGDLNAVGEWIGDTDLRTVKKSYLKERPEELRALAAKVGVGLPRPDRPSRQPNDNQRDTTASPTNSTASED